MNATIRDAADKIRLWREKPQVFAREVFGMEPDPWQDELFEVFPHEPRIAMKACAGPGKTAGLAILCWNFLLTRPHPKIAATAVSGDNLRDNLWTEMAKWRERSPLIKSAFEWQAERIFARDHPETWWMAARKWSKSATPDQQGNTLRGLHGDYVMAVVDESGGVPDPVMVTVENIGASAKEWHVLQAGNPTHLEGPLYRACTSARDLWYVIEITGDPDDPKRATRVSIDWARSQIAQHGRDNPLVMINVFGKFPPSSLNALLGPDDVNAALGRHAKETDYSAAPRILGVDVAREGDDCSVMFPRQGIVAFAPEIRRNIGSVEGAGMVSRKWQDWEADAAFVDNSGGFGGGWLDQLVTLGRNPSGVHFAASADDPRYANKRSEMYFRLAEWIKNGGCLPASCTELVGELTSTIYYFKGDKLALIDKDQIKAMLGRSPDRADALALTFAYPVAPRMPQGLPLPRIQRPYDPYARLN